MSSFVLTSGGRGEAAPRSGGIKELQDDNKHKIFIDEKNENNHSKINNNFGYSSSIPLRGRRPTDDRFYLSYKTAQKWQYVFELLRFCRKEKAELLKKQQA